MSVSPTLVEMPDLALSEVVKGLDFKAILALRKVCHRFRNFVDREEPESNLKIIDFFLSFPRIYLAITTQNGTKYSYMMNLTNLDEFNQFFSDFGILLKFQKTQLEKFCVLGIQPDLMYTRMYEKLGEVLQSKNPLLKTNMISMGASNENQVMRILPFLDPGSLNTMTIFPSHIISELTSLEEIAKLDQFKKCSSVVIPSISFKPNLEDIKHLKDIETSWVALTTMEEFFVMIKEAFTTSSVLQEWRFQNITADEKILVIEYSGWNFVLSDDETTKSWYIEVLETDLIFRMVLDEQLTFTRIDLFDVPEEATFLMWIL